MVLMKYIRANRFAPVYTLFWQGIFFVVGIVMVAIINAFINEDPTFACMGTLMALVGTLVGALARGNLNGHTRFRLAVSMGNTRKSYLLCDPIVTALTSAVGLLAAWLMYQVEKALFTAIYPTFENDMPLEIVFTWKILLLIIGLTVVMDLVVSTMMQRFGTKGSLMLWLCIWVPCMILPRTIDAYESGSTSILAKIGGAILTAIITIPLKGWIAIGVIFVLALLAFVVDTFRKAEVKL